MLNRIPAAPADDVFADTATLETPLSAAANDARRHVAVEAPVVHRCSRCGQTLRSAASVARGVGPVCALRIHAAMVVIGQTYQPHQIASATDLIADGGLIVGPGRTCLAVSSDGTSTYVVNPSAGTCTCKAGEYGRRCYHLAAAYALTA